MNLESILIMTVNRVRTFSTPFKQLSGRAKFIFNAIKNNIIIYHWETKTCSNDKNDGGMTRDSYNYSIVELM